MSSDERRGDAGVGGGRQEQQFDAVSSLAFLRSSWSSLVPSREWPLGSSRLDALLAGGSVSRLLRVLYELIQAFLRQPGRSTPLELSEDAVVNNPAMAVQTAIISLEDALEVDLSFINVANIAQGNKEDAINLCQTLHTLFSQVGQMDAELAEQQQREAAAARASEPNVSSQPIKSALKKSGSGSKKSEQAFQTFSRSGINRANPFQSEKASIYGIGGATSSPRDPFAEREAERRRDREDAAYFNEAYVARDADSSRPPTSDRTDEDYAFLRRRSDLPLHKLTRAQANTARELSFEPSSTTTPRNNPFRDGAATSARSSSLSPRRGSYREPPGTGVAAVSSAARASDEHLLGTIQYLEEFLSRARDNARVKAMHEAVAAGKPSPWKEKLARLGGPEEAGRQSVREEEEEEDLDYLGARQGRSRKRSSSAPRTRGYLAHTIESDPWGSSASTRRGGDSSSHDDRALAHLQAELSSMRRQAAGLSPVRSVREREHQVDVALENIRDRRDIESSIALLKDYTQGRRTTPPVTSSSPSSSRPVPLEHRTEALAHSVSERMLASEPQRTPAHRIPASHPHRTGKNHVRATCVYCQRELDWRAWDTNVRAILDHDLAKEQDPAAATSTSRTSSPSKRLYQSPEQSEYAVSRLRPLASSMLKTSIDLSHQHNNISNDFTGHFLSHLSASARRQAANRLDSLWTLASNAERDKQAHLSRMKREIEEEAFKRRVHMQLLEEQAIERTLKKTMVDKAQERELEKLIKEKSRHVSDLLSLKRESLANYTRDQCDLLAERRRVERATARLRAQNDRHSAREAERELRALHEAIKQKKIDQLQHAEDKFSFRMSELKRPPYSRRGADDIRFW